MQVDLPTIQPKTCPSIISSLPSSSSSSSFNPNPAVSAAFTGPLGTSCSSSTCSRDGGTSGRLEAVDGTEQGRASWSLYNLVLGHAPSRLEVEDAINALLNFMFGESSSGPELKRLQQKLDSFDPRLFLSHRYRRVYDAFQLLQADGSVKRLVLSLATDKAVWDAILKNELIQKLRESPCTVNYERLQRSNEEPDLAATIWRCIMDAAKEKVIELVEKFLSLVNELFQPAELEKPASGNKEQTDEKVRSSFLLAILILIIVVVTRVQNV